MRHTIYVILFGTLLVCVYANYQVINYNSRSIELLNDSVLNLAEMPMADCNEQILDLSVLNSIGIITDGTGHGSCVAIGPNLILTAGHCLGYDGSYVIMNGNKYNIINEWISDNHDIGFVYIDGKVPYLELGDMPKLLDKCYIVGCPADTILYNFISVGIVSKLDVTIEMWVNSIAVDVTSWYGNSGGPLLTPDGKIIGILVGGPSGTDSISVCESVENIKGTLYEYLETQ